MTMPKYSYPAVNIQFPISTEIANARKSIETRHYPLPKAYVGKPLFFIETPGRHGKFEARIIGVITFGESYEYKSKASFYKEEGLHLVTKKSPWSWKPGKTKWAWPIIGFEALEIPLPAPKEKGIKFTKCVTVSIKQPL